MKTWKWWKWWLHRNVFWLAFFLTTLWYVVEVTWAVYTVLNVE